MSEQQANTGMNRLSYTPRIFTNLETGEPYRRASLVPSGTEDTRSICAAVARDGTYGAAKTELIKNYVTAFLQEVRNALWQGKTVTIDGYFRLRGSFVGGIDPVTGKPTGGTMYRVRATPLKEMQAPVSEFELTNVATGAPEPTLTTLTSCDPEAVKDVLTRGKDIRIVGRNLRFNANRGDRLTLTYAEEGEERAVEFTPSEVDIVSFRVPWPQGLAEIAAGTAVLVSLATRAEDAKGAVSVASRKAVIAAE